VEDSLITPAGLSRLTDQLAHLKSAGRAEVTQRLREAFARGAGVNASAEYQAARDDQALLEWRIAELETRLELVRVAEADPDNGMVDVGELVRLRDLDSSAWVEYEVVGPLEADPVAGRISAASPLGRALLGRRKGEAVEVEAPGGRFRFKILRIGLA
jgi:transcription elongation factor GreA